MEVSEPKEDAVDEKEEACGSGKLPQSQRPGGKKRMVAVFVAFVGAGYSGMQYNPGIRTIEGELCKAMCAAGCISPQNAKDPTKVGWQRAARTDKGVSAVGNVVSLKLMIEFPDVVQRINAALPEQIRVLGFARVTKSFDARRLCDRRRYEYILPAFAFDPSCCRGTITPLAHVGAAGNIVEKHAGRELDLEAALKALPGAGTSGSPEAQAAVEGSLGEMQQGEPQNGSSGALQNRDSASRGEASLASQSAQPGNGLQPSHGSEKQANTVGQGSSSEEPQGSLNGHSRRPAGTQHDSAKQQHHSSNGQPDSPADHHKQQQSAGSTGQQTLGDAAGIAPHGRHAARYHVPEHYKSIRFTEEQQARLNKLLSNYEGTHNFHNYTVRVSPDDPAAMRYILSFKCKGTIEIQGQQWVRMVVLGQSFMLHQIRKLVGTVVAVMRGDAPPDCIALALQPERSVVTPMAPELGLFLDECVFKSYNDRWGNDREAQVCLGDFQEQVDAFKRDKIYPHIARHDAALDINAAWLQCLTDVNFKFSQWATTRAVRLNMSAWCGSCGPLSHELQERGAALQAQSELRTGPMHAGAGAKRKAEGELAGGRVGPADDSRPATSMGIGLRQEKQNEIMAAELSD